MNYTNTSYEQPQSSSEKTVQLRKNTVDYAVSYVNAVAAHNDPELWAEQVPVAAPVSAPNKVEYANPDASMGVNETLNGAQSRPQTSMTAGNIIARTAQQEQLLEARRIIDQEAA